MGNNKKSYRIRVGNLYFAGGLFGIPKIYLMGRDNARVFWDKKKDADYFCAKLKELFGSKCEVKVEQSDK